MLTVDESGNIRVNYVRRKYISKIVFFYKLSITTITNIVKSLPRNFWVKNHEQSLLLALHTSVTFRTKSNLGVSRNTPTQ